MRHTLRIPLWTPTLVNKLLKSHWGHAGKLKKSDAHLVATLAKLEGIPKATGMRLVSIEAHGWSRGRKPDPDNLLKSALDALVHAGMLVDDSGRWCELGPVSVVQDTDRYTVIYLEDV